jgi:hypothetical protein
MTFENSCKYVSSRGLLKSCVSHSSEPISSVLITSGYNFSELKDGDSLYICGTALKYFISKIFNKINKKIILVSGDCDLIIPNDIFSSFKEFSLFIDNEKIIHWFSQNLVSKYKNKLSCIPIGLDYHSLSSSNGKHALGDKCNPIDQENQLLFIKENSKPFWEREIKCYSSFHLFCKSRFGSDRLDAVKLIPKHLIYFEASKVERLYSWKTQTEYAFVTSPHGNGLDCHRTWEALCLGCIPIVKKSKIDDLYKDLPVLIVTSWVDITYELLSTAVEIFKKMHNENKFDYNRLTLEYWVSKINGIK